MAKMKLSKISYDIEMHQWEGYNGKYWENLDEKEVEDWITKAEKQIAELKGNKIITDTFIAWIWNKWNQPIGTKFAGFHTKKARDEFEAKMEELNKH